VTAGKQASSGVQEANAVGVTAGKQASSGVQEANAVGVTAGKQASSGVQEAESAGGDQFLILWFSFYLTLRVQEIGIVTPLLAQGEGWWLARESRLSG